MDKASNRIISKRLNSTKKPFGIPPIAGFFVEFNRFEIILFDALSIFIPHPKVITP
jgi:hypothetical protein